MIRDELEESMPSQAVASVSTTIPDRIKPTPFQKKIVARAAAAANWLVRSIDATGGRGSMCFYSRWYHPLRGWSWPYPETTGYIIPTLFDYAAFSKRPEFADIAVTQAEWIMSLQLTNGALPGEDVVKGKLQGPSVFNTGQMIRGLVAAADHTRDEKFLTSAARAAGWLADQVDESTGTWTRHAYISGFSPAYYTRVCWPMLEVYSRNREERIRNVALGVLDTILGLRQENGAFRNWSFRPGRPAFTHTIAYTIRGFLESGRLLGSDGERFTQAAMKSAELFRRRMELRGRLAGAYDEALKGRYWYTCLTGDCQMALIWMKVYDFLNDARYFSAALKALERVMSAQRMRSLDANVRGALPGSRPIWGRYLTLRYPNWATKFYLDALLHAHARLQHLLEVGPCAS